jgi:hypothetical protein
VAVRTDDVWVVGSRSGSKTTSTLALHWSGSAWSEVQTPNPHPRHPHAILRSVAADPSGALWAVGRHHYDGHLSEPLVERCA